MDNKQMMRVKQEIIWDMKKIDGLIWYLNSGALTDKVEKSSIKTEIKLIRKLVDLKQKRIEKWRMKNEK